MASGFSYATWRQALDQVARLAKAEPFALFLDEFTYLLEAEPELAGMLQNAWDHSLSQTRLFLALSGSHLGMMRRHLLAYEAPLYGRATSQLHLRPLPFGTTRSFFPRLHGGGPGRHLRHVRGGALVTPDGPNWRCTGTRLMDLKQVDEDLARWSG